MVAPIAYGAIGDAYMELEKPDEALKFYEKAVTKSENNFTTPIYLMKVGFVYEQNQDYEKALEAYQTIKNDFPESAEGRQIDKYIARVETLINK
jgi:tetratricopeptide (TPR) repeat protein